MPPSVAAQAELVFAVNEGVTYRTTSHETRTRYRELADALSRAVRRPVRIEPVENYKTLKQGLDDGLYELAYVHPAHLSLRAIRDKQYRMVALTRGFTDSRARFLATREMSIAAPQDLRGHTMVMPDPDSITAWMARATLRDLGLDPSKEKLGTTRYQDGIPFMMENGFYQVGITAANGIVRQWANRGGRIVHESPPVPIKHVIAAPDMPRADFERVQHLFLTLDQTDRGRSILTALGFQGFDRADDAVLAEATRWLGL